MRLQINKVMCDVYDCFGLCFVNDIQEFDEKDFVKLKWKSFLARNKRQRLRGQWFFDDWLLKKVRQCVKLFACEFKYDCQVLMPENEGPSIVKLETIPNNPQFCILISPRRGDRFDRIQSR